MIRVHRIDCNGKAVAKPSLWWEIQRLNNSLTKRYQYHGELDSIKIVNRTKRNV